MKAPVRHAWPGLSALTGALGGVAKRRAAPYVGYDLGRILRYNPFACDLESCPNREFDFRLLEMCECVPSLS